MVNRDVVRRCISAHLGYLGDQSIPNIRNLPSPFFFPNISVKHCLESGSSRSLTLWEWSEAEIWLHDLHLGEKLLGLRALDTGVHNHVVTWDPVDRSGHAVLVTSLERVDNAEDLGGVATSRCRVGKDETDGLLGIDHKDY